MRTHTEVKQALLAWQGRERMKKGRLGSSAGLDLGPPQAPPRYGPGCVYLPIVYVRLGEAWTDKELHLIGKWLNGSRLWLHPLKPSWPRHKYSGRSFEPLTWWPCRSVELLPASRSTIVRAISDHADARDTLGRPDRHGDRSFRPPLDAHDPRRRRQPRTDRQTRTRILREDDAKRSFAVAFVRSVPARAYFPRKVTPYGVTTNGASNSMTVFGFPGRTCPSAPWPCRSCRGSRRGGRRRRPVRAGPRRAQRCRTCGRC